MAGVSNFNAVKYYDAPEVTIAIHALPCMEFTVAENCTM